MKKTKILVSCLVLMMIIIPIVQAQDDDSPTPTPTPTISPSPSPITNADFSTYHLSFSWNLYAPARVVVEYKYTADFSGPVNVKTLLGDNGTVTQSVWSAVVSPISIEFKSMDIDSYEFDVILRYNATVGQYINVGLWSGTQAANSQRYWVEDSEVRLHFRINVSKEPTYPDTQDVAENVVMLLSQEMNDAFSQIGMMVKVLEENFIAIWAVVGVSFFTAILALIVGLLQIKSMKGRR